jgi:succinoglycan biosynthesis transport protein ExoP
METNHSPVQYQPPVYPPADYLVELGGRPQEKSEVHLLDYWEIIRKRCWTIISLLLISVTATLIVTFRMTPIYRATATIQINKENPQILDFKEVFAVDTMDLDYYQTQYKILESRALARRVVRLLKLSEHPDFSPSPAARTPGPSAVLLRFLSNLLGLPLTDPANRTLVSTQHSKQDLESRKESLLINQFLRGLKIEPIRNSRLVRIHFDAPDPILSAQVANTVATSYIQQNLDSRITVSQQAKEWLTGQLEDLRAKVERADEALQAFGTKHNIISVDGKEDIALQRLAELNDSLAKAEADRMAKEALHRQVRDGNVDALPSILENSLIQNLKQSYAQLESEYMKLSEKFKPEFSEMVRLRKQMDAVQKQLDRETDKMVSSIKNDYETAVRRESLIRRSFEEQKARVMVVQDKSIQYNILKREADTNKELYRGLLQRMKEAGVSAGITASNIQVVDEAEVPMAPYKPNKRANLLLAIVFGLFAGVGLVLFLEYLDNTVKTSEDLEQFARLPCFGMIPANSYERHKGIAAENGSAVELITFSHPRSVQSEAYRNVRTSILLSFSEKPPRVILVTSPNPGEGKTTTAINTAIALSQNGARVLLLDSDMRKPRVHTIFGNENGSGLSHVLSGNEKLEAAIRVTEIPNLYYIPSGSIPPNPSELLGSKLFKEVITSLAEEFDHIVVDSPPVLGFADAVVLSNSVDGVILVVHAGKTPKEALRQAKELLFQINAKILGVILNRVDIGRGKYGYYYYRYRYYYGQEGKKKKLTRTSTHESAVE